LPRSQGRRTFEVVDVVVIVLFDAHRLLSTFARRHSAVPTVARGSLEVLVERVEVQSDGMPDDEGLWTRGHRARPCLSEFTPSSTR
jgi:hypothetical protein